MPGISPLQERLAQLEEERDTARAALRASQAREMQWYQATQEARGLLRDLWKAARRVSWENGPGELGDRLAALPWFKKDAP